MFQQNKNEGFGGPLESKYKLHRRAKKSAKIVGSVEINLHLITNRRVYFEASKDGRVGKKAKKDLKLIMSLRLIVERM